MVASVDGILTSIVVGRAAQVVLLCLSSDQCMQLISMIFIGWDKREIALGMPPFLEHWVCHPDAL
jgi:hypothetical protein